MDPIEALTSVKRAWSGTNTLQDPITGKPEESSSTVAITPVLAGRFVRLDYTWAYQGAPQEGSILIGFDAGEVSAHWIDAWHMGRKVMACAGTAADGVITVRGSFAAPPGPDWGWRIAITTSPLRITHTNIHPDGEEDLAAEGVYG